VHSKGHIAGIGSAYYCPVATNLISSDSLEWLGWNFEVNKNDNFTNSYTATVKGSDYAVIFNRHENRWHTPLSELMKLCNLNAKRLQQPATHLSTHLPQFKAVISSEIATCKTNPGTAITTLLATVCDYHLAPTLQQYPKKTTLPLFMRMLAIL